MLTMSAFQENWRDLGKSPALRHVMQIPTCFPKEKRATRRTARSLNTRSRFDNLTNYLLFTVRIQYQELTRNYAVRE